MKKRTLFLSLAAVVMFTSCTENQANGERIGMITKFTKGGIIWKSHEAHLNATQTGMNSAEGFDFSVDNDINDPVIIATLDSAATLYLSGAGTSTRSAYIQGINTGGANNAHAITFGTSAGSTAPTERMRLNSSGNLLIGDSTAYAMGNIPRIQISSTGSGASTINVITWSAASASTSPSYVMGRSRGAPGVYTSVVSNDDLGFLTFYGADGTDLQSAAFIRTTVDGTPATGFVPATLRFYTGSSTVNPTERMRISGAGNMLVGGSAARGTTVGTSHIDLFDGTAPAGTLTNGVSLYSSSGDLYFMDSAGNGYEVGFRNIPPVGTKTGSYTLAVADVGKYVQVGTGGSITIPNSTFSEGDVVSVFNNTTGNITITCTITTAYIGGVNTDRATVTLATRGIANIFFISGTVCVINGNVS